MLNVAVLKPTAPGLNVTLKVVLPEAETEPDGLAVIVKSLALAPVIEIAPTVNEVVPVF